MLYRRVAVARETNKNPSINHAWMLGVNGNRTYTWVFLETPSQISYRHWLILTGTTKPIHLKVDSFLLSLDLGSLQALALRAIRKSESFLFRFAPLPPTPRYTPLSVHRPASTGLIWQRWLHDNTLCYPLCSCPEWHDPQSVHQPRLHIHSIATLDITLNFTVKTQNNKRIEIQTNQMKSVWTQVRVTLSILSSA